jgi:hypothetical protein
MHLAMAKLYVTLQPHDITVKSRSLALEHLLTGTNLYDPARMEALLQQYRQFHAQAVLFQTQKRYERALDLWEKLGRRELVDEDSMDGVNSTVNLLKSLDDSAETQALVYKYAAWVLRVNRVKGMEVRLIIKIF